MDSTRQWREARAAYSRDLQAAGMEQETAAVAALRRYPVHAGLWVAAEDGPYVGTDADHAMIMDRARALYGADARCQFSAHGAGHYSVAVFAGPACLIDRDLT